MIYKLGKSHPLQECPRCGKEPKLEENTPGKWVECSECGVYSEPQETWKKAQEQWNNMEEG